MMIKQYYFLLIFFVSLLTQRALGQTFIGLSAGICSARFYDFTQDENYQTGYDFRSGTAVSIRYGAQIDSTEFNMELEYNLQSAGLIIYNRAGNFSSYNNVNYTLNQLNFHLYYSFPIIPNNVISLDFSPGIVIGYSILARAKGSGWNYVSETQYDSVGNPHQVLAIRHWIKDENRSSDLSKLNFGLSLALCSHFPISNRIDLTFQGRGVIYLSNFTNLENSYYTSMIAGQLNLGLRYYLTAK